MNLQEAVWRKSGDPRSTSCVEVAVVDGTIAVRDSSDPTGPVLLFTPSEWQAFVEGAKDGEFDV